MEVDSKNEHAAKNLAIISSKPAETILVESIVVASAASSSTESVEGSEVVLAGTEERNGLLQMSNSARARKKI